MLALKNTIILLSALYILPCLAQSSFSSGRLTRAIDRLNGMTADAAENLEDITPFDQLFPASPRGPFNEYRRELEQLRLAIVSLTDDMELRLQYNDEPFEEGAESDIPFSAYENWVETIVDMLALAESQAGILSTVPLFGEGIADSIGNFGIAFDAFSGEFDKLVDARTVDINDAAVDVARSVASAIDAYNGDIVS